MGMVLFEICCLFCLEVYYIVDFFAFYHKNKFGSVDKAMEIYYDEIFMTKNILSYLTLLN